MARLGALAAAIALSACALAGCSSSSPNATTTRTSTTSTKTTASTAPTTTSTAPTTTAAPVTTTTPVPTSTTATNASQPAFVGTVSTVTEADLPYTYRAGCPVGVGDLRMLHMSYWGFDGAPHTGAMVVHASVTDDVLAVFSTLFNARFPIRQMVPVDAFQGSDPASMEADNTSGFNCRDAVADGPPQWSVHAYGEAIDVNTVENPYLQGGAVQPAAGSAYLDRSDVRSGMAVDGGVLVSAFASVGWQWGGRWAGTPDYQHFSKTGG